MAKLERTRPAPASPLRPNVEDVAVPGPAPAPEPRPSAEDQGVADSDTAEVSESGGSVVPKYLTLERKETRLRSDQVSALGKLARDLSARRRRRDERITENTLMRIAVDVLLEQAGELAGDTEVELRESVTAEVRKFGT